jgi:alkanesulfonate monooxygenase SsuD/methylene tetrahydromethanopterin reductase-like flavin-dependent oxidoreductase (luciferase family)
VDKRMLAAHPTVAQPMSRIAQLRAKMQAERAELNDFMVDQRALELQRAKALRESAPESPIDPFLRRLMSTAESGCDALRHFDDMDAQMSSMDIWTLAHRSDMGLKTNLNIGLSIDSNRQSLLDQQSQ